MFSTFTFCGPPHQLYYHEMLTLKIYWRQVPQISLVIVDCSCSAGRHYFNRLATDFFTVSVTFTLIFFVLIVDMEKLVCRESICV